MVVITNKRPVIRQWLDSLGAEDLIDWRCVEQPSAQYPIGRWEALVMDAQSGAETWRFAPPEVLPGGNE